MEAATETTPTPADEKLEVERQRASLANTYLRKFFEVAVRYEASDLLMRGDQVPRLRLRGALKALDVPPLEPAAFEQAVQDGLSPVQRQMYAEHGALDLAFDLDAGHRFRVNVFRTRGRTALAARRVSNKILTFEELMLPPVLSQVCEGHQGLVIVCGITGSGKSTTLASMIQWINERRPCHIVTIEDPIEYLFPDAKAIVNQREVGIDVASFNVGLRYAVRESPDVMLIGEMRDKETFEAALRAAETGHLVFGTIHASSASQAFGRIYDLFPPEERTPIRNMLAYQMRAFVYQKLLPSIRPEIQRVPAVEVLLQSPPTRKYIVEAREHELTEVIKDARQAGMQTFTDSLVDLVEKQIVHPRVAMQNAGNPEEVKMRLRGISTD